MKRLIGSGCAEQRRPRGFTLVELLVVIVIIGILISLLVPAVGAVKRVAKEAATRAALQTISTGLETFKTDAKLGGLYPPSASDWVSGAAGAPPIVRSPYSPPPSNTNIQIAGAGLLVWALSGADLLGAPGFAVFNPADPTRPMWGQWSGNAYNSTNPSWSDAYALDSSNQPVHARYGPYVDASKIKVTQNEGGMNNRPDFKIPEETRARAATGAQTVVRDYPLYLDAFGYPILYWRADPAGRQMADQFRGENSTPRGVYHWEDNVQLHGDPGNPNLGEPLVLNKAGEKHQLGWNNEFRTVTAGSNLINPCFGRYICNNAVKARFEAQRPDSFLLASPGADGVFGTADDVTNFTPNGK